MSFRAFPPMNLSVLLFGALLILPVTGLGRPPDVSAGCTWDEGAIVRGPVGARRIALVFTGHEFAEGADMILDALARHHARASFFLTGVFLDNPAFAPTVRRIVAEGHYLGPHSDQHLLLCDWSAEKKRLVSRAVFMADLTANREKIARVTPESPRWFLPPYENYDAEIARWTEALGLRLVNYTPGTRSAADYTAENARNFVASAAIVRSILEREQADPHGLNGFLLLLHLGAGPARADKMHRKFPALLDELVARGYRCVRIDELLAPKEAAR
jgi:peptidoglycan/xylan/chitin deacetylase (PgdA/CDA1 family)